MFKVAISILTLFLLGCDFNKNTQSSFEILFNVQVKQEDVKEIEDGIVPWISIENPERDLARLVNSTEIVIKKNKVILMINYPLKNPVEFELYSDVGFTRAILIKEISAKYKYVYKKEQETAQQKVIPIDERKGLINRNTTDGVYGIWGHDIGDLDLTGILVIEESGKVYLKLNIES